MTKKIGITNEQISKIQKILDNFGKNYINIEGSIEWFEKVYIKQISKIININNKILCDCACGYGWLTFAYILNGANNRAVCIDMDRELLHNVKNISDILGVSDRMTFILGDIAKLPLKQKCIDIFATIETLEHVGDNPDLQMKYYARKDKDMIISMFNKQRELQLIALEEIRRVTSEAVIIATPNKFYFKDVHDTGLKFVHLIPRYMGIKYSLRYSKEGYSHAPLHSRFISHYELENKLHDFNLVTPFFCCKNVEEYQQLFPTYYPYGNIGGVTAYGITGIKLDLIRLMFLILGKRIRYFMPRIQGIYVRTQSETK